MGYDNIGDAWAQRQAEIEREREKNKRTIHEYCRYFRI